MLGGIFQDWSANRGNLRSQLALALFRSAQACRRLPPLLRWLGWPVLALHELFVVWILGIELNPKARVGPGLRIFHGVGLVLHEHSVLGAGCTLRQSTTIGNRRGPCDAPVLGDGVDVGANVVLIGAIRIGDGAVIGAGSVVLDDVAPGVTVAGNPAKVIKP